MSAATERQLVSHACVALENACKHLGNGGVLSLEVGAYVSHVRLEGFDACLHVCHESDTLSAVVTLLGLSMNWPV